MANAKLGTKAVGSIVKLKAGGTAKEFIVAHQGKPSSMYDSSCDGTWLLMKDCYEKHVWHSSNINKYETSDINTYLNGPFFNLFDSNIQGIIKQVKIPYRKNGGKWGTDQSGANGLPAKIFLLAGYEVGWTTSDGSYFPVDGAKLDYFAASSGGNSKRIANFNGSATSWWLRSPYTDGADRVWDVNSQGRYGGGYASDSFGIRPALVLPPDMEVDSSGNVTLPSPATHKTLINGTLYEVKGGKCLVNGTVYSIKKGRTLIAGTGYDIKFSDGLTWVINEKPDIPYSPVSWNADFICEALPSIQKCYVITMGYYPSAGLYAIGYGQGAIGSTDVYYSTKGWLNNAYRTITFREPPTGDLLTWLQANAVQQ
nr:MAG TPA: tail protein [Bacteriophage sp.]